MPKYGVQLFLGLNPSYAHLENFCAMNMLIDLKLEYIPICIYEHKVNPVLITLNKQVLSCMKTKINTNSIEYG